MLVLIFIMVMGSVRLISALENGLLSRSRVDARR